MNIRAVVSRTLSTAICAAMAGTFSVGSNAQGLATKSNPADYPSKLIEIVVPFAAGGGIDLMTRVVSEPLAQKLGQRVVVINRPGAGGIVGTQDFLRNSTADGYRLFMGSASLTVTPAIDSSAGYDPTRDFSPIAQALAGHYVLVISSALPVNTVSEFISYARSNPGKLNFASQGVGSGTYLLTQYFKALTGLDLVHVSYKSSVDGLVAMSTGDVHLTFDSVANVSAFLAKRQVRGLAVTGRERFGALKDLPTMAEAGIQDFEVEWGAGILGPAGLPANVIARLNTEIVSIMARQDVKDKVALLGAYVVAGSAAQFGQFIATDYARWQKIAKSAAKMP